MSEELKDQEELQNSEHNVKEIERDLGDIHDKYMRVCSDYSNLKRRSEHEKKEIENYTTIKIVKQFLPVLDAVNVANVTEKANEISEGFNILKENILYVMEQLGVEEVPGLNETFNPKWHEAISVTIKKDVEPNTITNVIVKGYRIGDKVIRQSMVEVSTK